jgi:hypothetical protein
MDNAGKPAPHTQEFISRIFDDELEKLQSTPDAKSQRYAEAREISEAMVVNGEFDPF